MWRRLQVGSLILHESQCLVPMHTLLHIFATYFHTKCVDSIMLLEKVILRSISKILTVFHNWFMYRPALLIKKNNIYGSAPVRPVFEVSEDLSLVKSSFPLKNIHIYHHFIRFSSI